MKKLCEQYALALYELAEENKCEDVILAEMQDICKILEQNPKYVKLLDNPAIEKAKRTELAGEAFKEAEQYLKNFIMLLVEARRMCEFAGCTKAMSRIFDEKHNVLRAEAVTALSLNEAQAGEIRKKLEKSTGKTVILTNTVDSSVIGGVLLKYGGAQIDMSVRSGLDTLSEMIAKADI